jgi:hypothetical protein
LLENDATAESFADGFGLGMDVKFLVNASNVVTDGVNADSELVARSLVAMTFRQVLKQTNFLRSQLLINSLR